MDPHVPIIEHHLTVNRATGDEIVPLELKQGACVTADIYRSHGELPFSNATSLLATESKLEALPSLHFVPYYFRANRGGKGQMRVGLPRWFR